MINIIIGNNILLFLCMWYDLFFIYLLINKIKKLKLLITLVRLNIKIVKI